MNIEYNGSNLVSYPKSKWYAYQIGGQAVQSFVDLKDWLKLQGFIENKDYCWDPMTSVYNIQTMEHQIQVPGTIKFYSKEAEALALLTFKLRIVMQ